MQINLFDTLQTQIQDFIFDMVHDRIKKSPNDIRQGVLNIPFVDLGTIDDLQYKFELNGETNEEFIDQFPVLAAGLINGYNVVSILFYDVIMSYDRPINISNDYEYDELLASWNKAISKRLHDDLDNDKDQGSVYQLIDSELNDMIESVKQQKDVDEGKIRNLLGQIDPVLDINRIDFDHEPDQKFVIKQLQTIKGVITNLQQIVTLTLTDDDDDE